jgi:NADH-quinone oxidoreductase subunit M
VIYLHTGTTEIPEMTARLATNAIDLPLQKLLWVAMFASFAVKVPMWPFHTWLPDAHVEAPTAGSVLLAGVLLKLGGYGFLRFSLPMLPEASAYFAPFVFALSIVAIVYTSLVALMQTDMKKLIAYSSVAHMGIVTIGIFTPNALGLEGSIVQMLSHGLVSGALFMVVGVVYDRIHSREIAAYGGLAEVMPVYAFTFMLFMMASVGLPGTSGFVGEILVIVGVFQYSSWVAGFAATGMILGAAYMLWLYRRVVFGEFVKETLKGIRDMRANEVIAFAPLVVLAIVMGVYPSLFLDPMHASVNQLLAQIGVETTNLALR